MKKTKKENSTDLIHMNKRKGSSGEKTKEQRHI